MNEAVDKAPKVFLSHASEDKDAFVIDFATRLRERGIDAWLDRWEMYPGDSLVDKIFEEGIKNANAIIIVLSKNSVHKPWVKEELNAAVVKRLNDGCRLIPVVIDDCDIPESLKATLWQKIEDVHDYNVELDRIVAAILDKREKPPLGSRPRYVAILDKPIGRLSRIDTFIFKAFGDEAIRSEDWICIDTERVWQEVAKFDIPREEYLDSLEVLTDVRYLKPSPEVGLVPPFFTLTLSGFDQYCRSYLADYEELLMSIASLIVNEGVVLNSDIAARLGRSEMVSNLLLKILKRRSFVELDEAMGGFTQVSAVKPKMKRMLQEVAGA